MYCNGNADGRLNGITDATAIRKPPILIAWGCISFKCTVIILHLVCMVFTDGAKGAHSNTKCLQKPSKLYCTAHLHGITRLVAFEYPHPIKSAL